MLIHFVKANVPFLCPLKISESFGSLMFDEVGNGILAKLDHQQY